MAFCKRVYLPYLLSFATFFALFLLFCLLFFIVVAGNKVVMIICAWHLFSSSATWQQESTHNKQLGMYGTITNLVLPTMFPPQTSFIVGIYKETANEIFNSYWKNNKSKTRILRILHVLIVIIHHHPISDPKMRMVLHHHRHHLRHLLLHLWWWNDRSLFLLSRMWKWYPPSYWTYEEANVTDSSTAKLARDNIWYDKTEFCWVAQK